MAVRKQVLDERPVRARHAGVVAGDAVGQQVLQRGVLRRLRLCLQDLAAVRRVLCA